MILHCHMGWAVTPISVQRNAGVAGEGSEHVRYLPSSAGKSLECSDCKMPEEASGLARRLSTHLGLLRPDTLVLVVRGSRGHHYLVREAGVPPRQGVPSRTPRGPETSAPPALAAHPAPPRLPPAG